jgi:hypothetical protein
LNFVNASAANPSARAPAADIAPIRAPLDQGCDLEADVVLIVARELPELPRPLKEVNG